MKKVVQLLYLMRVMLQKKIDNASAHRENGSGSFSGSTAIFFMVPVPLPILNLKKRRCRFGFEFHFCGTTAPYLQLLMERVLGHS